MPAYDMTRPSLGLEVVQQRQDQVRFDGMQLVAAHGLWKRLARERRRPESRPPIAGAPREAPAVADLAARYLSDHLAAGQWNSRGKKSMSPHNSLI